MSAHAGSGWLVKIAWASGIVTRIGNGYLGPTIRHWNRSAKSSKHGLQIQ
jgi:hypothetical protein